MKQILFLLGLLIFFSCKKKSENEPISNNNSTAQNGIDTINLTFNTEISLREYYGLPQNNSFGSYSWIRFTTNAQLGVGDSIGVYGGNSNGHWQKFTGGGSISNTETDSTTANVKFRQQYYWMVNASHIPNNQYLTTKISPYIEISYFQNVNTISKSTGITVSHPTLSCSMVDYYISDNPNLYITVDGNVNLGGSYHYIKKTVYGNSSGVVFTPSDLSSISITNSGFICARAYNIETIYPTQSSKYIYKNITRLTKSNFPITN